MNETGACRLTHAPRGLPDPYSGVPADELLQSFIEGTNVDGTRHFQHHGAAGQPANQVQDGRTGVFPVFQSVKGNVQHSESKPDHTAHLCSISRHCR